MSEILLPRRFKGQPQYPAPLDQSNPLAKDFTVFINFATPQFNAATGKTLSISTTGAGVTQRAIDKGIALYTPNNAWADIAVGEDWIGPNTIIGILRLNSIDNPWGGLFSKDTIAGTTQFAVGRDNTTNSLYGSVENGTAVSFGGASIPSLSSVSVVAFTHSGVASTPMSYWRNGQLVGSTTALGTQNSGTGVLGLGRSRDASATYDSDVDWLSILRAKRVFSAPEIASVATPESIWALQKAPSRRLWAVIPGGINLVGSNASQGNTASTAAVTQAQVLSGSNSAQANTASTAAITQTQVLSGANSVQSNLGSSGAITLSEAIVLIGVNVTQANTCSVGAITNADIYLPPANSDFVWLGFASGEC